MGAPLIFLVDVDVGVDASVAVAVDDNAAPDAAAADDDDDDDDDAPLLVLRFALFEYVLD